MKLRLLLIYTVSLSLLAGCGGKSSLTPTDSPTAIPAGLTSQTPILPGSKGDRNGILPGSKGDRNHILALEVEVVLPNPGFTTLAAADEPGLWQARVDGQAVTTNLSRSAKNGSDNVLTFSLKDVISAESGVQEIVFVSPSGVIQTAGLVPALNPAHTRLPEILGCDSQAVWMIADRYQKNQKKLLKDLTPEALALIRAQSDVSQLSQSLKDFYRQNKGQLDPESSPQIKEQSEKASKAVAEKMKPEAAGVPASAMQAGSGGAKPAGQGGPGTNASKAKN